MDKWMDWLLIALLEKSPIPFRPPSLPPFHSISLPPSLPSIPPPSLSSFLPSFLSLTPFSQPPFLPSVLSLCFYLLPACTVLNQYSYASHNFYQCYILILISRLFIHRTQLHCIALYSFHLFIPYLIRNTCNTYQYFFPFWEILTHWERYSSWRIQLSSW